MKIFSNFIISQKYKGSTSKRSTAFFFFSSPTLQSDGKYYHTLLYRLVLLCYKPDNISLIAPKFGKSPALSNTSA